MKGPLPDNYLHTLTPAGLIAWVAQVTLARISLMGKEELIRIGWYGNPVVDILYSMTSAGVWIARTDTSGYPLIQDVAGNAKLVVNKYVMRPKPPAFVSSGYSSFEDDGATRQLIPKYFSQAFTSNAGGSLDADVTVISNVASYKGRLFITALYSTDVGGAGTPTLKFTDTTTGIIKTLVLATTGDYAPVVNLNNILIYSVNANEAIKLDTTCADLGNTKTWVVEGIYFYEA